MSGIYIYSLGIVLHDIDDSCVRLRAEEELGLMRKERAGRQVSWLSHSVMDCRLRSLDIQ